jgi:hypothetical protein
LTTANMLPILPFLKLEGGWCIQNQRSRNFVGSSILWADVVEASDTKSGAELVRSSRYRRTSARSWRRDQITPSPLRKVLGDATGLSRGGSRWWLLPPKLFSSMPRACPVEAHAGGYRRQSFFPRCHGLVPWRLTLVATAAATVKLLGTSPWPPGERPPLVAASASLHGTRPWHLVG